LKRWLILGLIIGFGAFSAIVFADDAENYLYHQDDLGVVINTTISSANVNLTDIQNREPGAYTPDGNGASQSVQLALNAEAYIPCYLKMVVTTNLGRTALESFGPDAAASKQEDNYYLIFDNEIGGFVTEDWTVAGHGRNAEIEPGTGYYIRGCDQVKVELYSNDTYKYDITAAPLEPADGDVSSATADQNLDLQMRTMVDSGNWSATWSFGANGTEYPVSQKAACESATVYHDFRVPYLKTTAHGEYSGVIVLKAYTL
jgi:hypothetical protein